MRRMFGGAGLYADGVMFGLVSGGQIYLKANAAMVPQFEREGCGQPIVRMVIAQRGTRLCQRCQILPRGYPGASA